TLGVGSDLLFQILEPKTRPTFTTQFVTDGTCKGAGGGSIGCGGSADSGSAAPGGLPGKQDQHTVDVSFHGNVGPFDAAVVRSDDAMALETWLAQNMYFVTPE